MSKESIRVPDLGGAANVEVIELCVTIGDQVDEGQSLVVVESDKASMEIPSPSAGKVLSIEVSEGAEVNEGDVIVELSLGEGAAQQESTAQDTEAEPEPEQEPQAESQLEKPKEKPAASSIATERQETVVVPDLGGADSVELIEILVASGDSVSEGDGLMVMESDKASMELPSPVSGVVEKVLVEMGAQLAEGSPVAEIRVQGEAGESLSPSEAMASESQPAAKEDKPKPAPSPVTAAATAPVEVAEQEPAKGVYAGPAVRKLARELGVELSQVKGSGPKGRISKDDLHNFVRQAVASPASGASTGGAGIPAVPAVDFAQFGEIDAQPMSRLHKLTAANMQRSWLNVPHVTQFDEADITELEAFRQGLKPEMEKQGIKLSPLPFILKAVAAALKAHPVLNASLAADGESIVYKQYVHIGIAVDTPAGLMVPVIRDVDQKGLWTLGEEVLELATLAKQRKLKPGQMQGACFTVSSLGGIGGQGFTPIVNTPEVGILGVSRVAVKPVYIDGEFQPRQMLPLSLSYDHRAVNGGDAGRFLTDVVANLAEMRRILLGTA